MSVIEQRRAPLGSSTIAAMCAVVIGLHPCPARAEAPDTEARAHARQLADEAADAYAAGKYEHAHELLGRAFAYVPAPTISLLDARALVRLGRWLDAKSAYERSASTTLPENAPASFRKAVNDARSELAALEPRIPTLRIVLPNLEPGDMPQISVDGQLTPLEVLAEPLRLDPKAHRVRLRLSNGKELEEHVMLSENERRTLTFRVPPVNASRTTESRRRWGWISVGLGGAGLATGVITGAIAMGVHSRAEDECPARHCAPGSSGADALDTFRTYRAISTVGYVAGVAGVGLGAVLLITSPRSSTRVGIAPSFNGLRVVGEM